MKKEYTLWRGLRIFGYGGFFVFLVKDRNGNIYIPRWDNKFYITKFECLDKKCLKRLKPLMIKIPDFMKVKKMQVGKKIFFGQLLIIPLTKNKKILLQRIVKHNKIRKKLME